MRISDWSSDVCSSDLMPFTILARSSKKRFSLCMSIFLSRGSSPRLSLAPSPYLGAGGGGDKGFGVGIALIDLEIEDRRKAEPRHIGDQQPRRGFADRREGEGGRGRDRKSVV